MKKALCIVIGITLSIHSLAQQPLEDQRLSTSNNVSFQNISLLDASFPKIDFNGRLLFRSITDNNLKYRYNGVNDAELLHGANFNTYSPTLTGGGSSGNWPISITGTAPFLKSYLGPNTIIFGWDANNIKIKAKIDETEFSAVPMNISGNASFWGGRTADLSVQQIPGVGLIGINSDGIATATNDAQLKAWLGLPYSGETLQSVTERGSITTNGITVDKAGGNWISGNFGNNIGNNRVVMGYLSGAATIGAHNAALNAWANLAINSEGGNVGIGTATPAERLEVNGNAKISGDFYFADGKGIGWPSPGKYGAIVNNGSGLLFYTGTTGYTERLKIDANGNVGIGTPTQESYKLAVEGTVGARKVKVTQETWPDFVFDSSYQLTPLPQIEQYIRQNKHLPDVPSTAEVKKDGLNLGDNQALLLKKIEELTLYIISQNKRLEAQDQRLRELESKLK